MWAHVLSGRNTDALLNTINFRNILFRFKVLGLFFFNETMWKVYVLESSTGVCSV